MTGQAEKANASRVDTLRLARGILPALTTHERTVVMARTGDHGLHVATIYMRRVEDSSSVEEIIGWKPNIEASTPYAQALAEVVKWQKELADKSRSELIETVEEAREFQPENAVFGWLDNGRAHDEALRPAYISAERIICNALLNLS